MADELSHDFLPAVFKNDAGVYNTKGFMESFDALTAFKAQAEEATAALPKTPADYVFAVPDDHVFPEGFDASKSPIRIVDDKGEPVLDDKGQDTFRDFTVNDMIDPNDTDIVLLQALVHKYAVKPEIMGELASIIGNREIRGLMKAGVTADQEKAALGPDGQSRIDTVNRALAGKLNTIQARAVSDNITGADMLRGIEALLKTSNIPPASNLKPGLDNANASIDDRIMAGLEAADRKAG